jgi:hypothetical protein
LSRVFTVEQALTVRTRAQGLASRDPSKSIVQVVRDCGGVQAQDAPAAALSVRVRSNGRTATEVEQARVEERSIIRTWGMRGTLHLLATEDAGWLLPLLGPGLIRGNQGRRTELGLDDETCERGCRALREVLGAQGPLTRAEIVAQLDARGIHLAGQAAPHLLFRAALEGLICLGPDRGAQPTYVLLADWTDLGAALPREKALAELARRHLAAYGPAGAEDLAAWSGLPMSEARAGWQAIAGELQEVEIAGRPAWMLKAHAAWRDAPPDCPSVRLLPAFDTYLLGHRNRDLILAPEYAKRVNAGGGIIHPTLLVDGRVAGTWRKERQRDRLAVTVAPFADLAPPVQAGVEAEIRDIGRFLELPVQWKQ